MSRPRQHPLEMVRRQAYEAWPALGAWQVQVVQGNVRVGDGERDAAAQSLGEHYAAGRLERDEYDQRLDVVLAARTRGELARVFRDLPARPVAPPVPPPATRRSARRRLPVLPVLLVLIGLAVLLDSAWPVLIGLGLLLLARSAMPGARADRPGCGPRPR